MNKSLFFWIIAILATKTSFSLSPHRVYIGPDVYYRDYNENLEAPKKSHEFGTLYGFQAGYSYIKPNTYYFGTDLRVSGGYTVYDGSLQNLNTYEITPYKSNTENGFVNIEARFGKTFIDGCLQYIPFIGLGGHYWYRGPAPNNPYGFSEEYTWGYFAFGVQLQYGIDINWSIGLNLKGMQMFSGIMYAAPLRGSTFYLGNLLQYEVEFPISYSFNNTCSFLSQISFVPYYRNQNIGKSNNVTTDLPSIGQVTLYEPSSKTNLAGARLEFAYNF
jgi:hypothetical protein